jgi:two-component system, response regulator PdtaR
VKVLVVEDESLLALEIEYQLTQAGYEVIGPIADHHTALALGTSEKPFLALVDVDTNPDERVALICALNGLLGIRSVVLTTANCDESLWQGAVVAILCKPFRPDEIAPAIEFASEVAVGDYTSTADAPAGLQLLGPRPFTQPGV